MFDADLLFYSALAVTTSGTGGLSTSSNPKALRVDKTPAEGHLIEVAVTAVAGSSTGGTMTFAVLGSDDDVTYTAVGNVVTGIVNTAVNRYFKRVQTKYKYIRLDPTVGTGTGFSATITAGIVTGGQRDTFA